MSWSVLKDIKTMLGFITSLLSAVVAVVMSINNSSYWIVFVVFSLLISFFSVRRADSVYKQINN